MTVAAEQADWLWAFSSGDAAETVSADRVARLVTAARAGETDAFDQLMESCQDRVYRTAARLLARRDDSDDAVQEVFLRLHRALPSFDPEREFSPWLYRITVNVCRDLNRRRRFWSWVSLEAWTAGGGEEPAAEPSDPRLRDLERALRKLPPAERRAVVLRDVEGLTAQEAGEALGVTPETVRSQASRGRARLRRWMEGKR